MNLIDSDQTPLPLDDDYYAIRQALWIVTDGTYKKALERLARKIATLQNQPRKDTVPDFIQIEATKSFEPIQKIDVKTPQGTESGVLAIINKHRGRVNNVIPEGEYIRVQGQLPAAELIGIADEIRGTTQGRAFPMTFIKKLLLWAILGGILYFFLSYHIIYIDNSLKLLKKSELTLECMFYSAELKTSKTILSVDILRENGIGDLLVEMGRISEEEKESLLDQIEGRDRY